MNIGLDFDDVIATTIYLKHRMAKELFGVEGIPSYRFKEGWVVGEGRMTKGQYRKLMNTVCGDREIGLKAAPVKGAEIFIPKLQKDGHHLIIITSREDSEFEVAREWCRQKGYEFEYISVGYGKDKKEPAKGLQIYLDDDLSKLLPLVSIVPHLYLFSRDHNREVELPENIKRIDSWEDFYKEINLLSKVA